MIPSSLWSLAYSTSYTLNDSEFLDFIAILKSSIITIFSGLFFYFSTLYYRNKNNVELIDSLYKNSDNIEKYLPLKSIKAFEEWKKIINKI